MPIENMEWTADRTNVGRYELSREAVAEISNFHNLYLTTGTVYKGSPQVYGNMLYGGNPQNPQVGDVRVSYTYAGNAEEGREDTVSGICSRTLIPSCFCISIL